MTESWYEVAIACKGLKKCGLLCTVMSLIRSSLYLGPALRASIFGAHLGYHVLHLQTHQGRMMRIIVSKLVHRWFRKCVNAKPMYWPVLFYCWMGHWEIMSVHLRYKSRTTKLLLQCRAQCAKFRLQLQIHVISQYVVFLWWKNYFHCSNWANVTEEIDARLHWPFLSWRIEAKRPIHSSMN